MPVMPAVVLYVLVSYLRRHGEKRKETCTCSTNTIRATVTSSCSIDLREALWLKEGAPNHAELNSPVLNPLAMHQTNPNPQH